MSVRVTKDIRSDFHAIDLVPIRTQVFSSFTNPRVVFEKRANTDESKTRSISAHSKWHSLWIVGFKCRVHYALKTIIRNPFIEYRTLNSPHHYYLLNCVNKPPLTANSNIPLSRCGSSKIANNRPKILVNLG